MQYILEKEEYDELVAGAEKIKLMIEEADTKKTAVLQSLCTEVAIHKPIKYWGNEEPMPWGCVLEVGLAEEDMIDYCDECPVQHLCPYEYKQWSK